MKCRDPLDKGCLNDTTGSEGICDPCKILIGKYIKLSEWSSTIIVWAAFVWLLLMTAAVVYWIYCDINGAKLW